MFATREQAAYQKSGYRLRFSQRRQRRGKNLSRTQWVTRSLVRNTGYRLKSKSLCEGCAKTEAPFLAVVYECSSPAGGAVKMVS